MSMEGLPMLACLIQHTLKGLCTISSSSSSDNNSKWVYAVFWRILPRIYPPPKWDYEAGGALDRAKGNKRNWILVWEDGFCDLDECEPSGNNNNGFLKGRFGSDIFFKLSHEVYNYGEGLIGKVAADNSHRWVFHDGSNDASTTDPNFLSSWNATIDPQPKAWDFHFDSGIKTIAVISVREGIIQLGSFHKIVEDLNLVLSIRRKFSYLRSIPGLFPIQRSTISSVQCPYNPLKHKSGGIMIGSDEAQQLNGSKAEGGQVLNHKGPIWSLDYSDRNSNNSQENGRIGLPLWHIPPLLPYKFGSHDNPTRIQNDGDNVCRVKDPNQESKPGSSCFHPLVMELGFGPMAQEGSTRRK